MEMPVVHEAPSWSSPDDVGHDGAADTPLLGPQPIAAPAAYHQAAGSWPDVPSYPADPSLPFAPAGMLPAPSMQPAFAGAPFPGGDYPRSQLAQDQTVQPPLGGHVLGVITLAVGIGAASGVYYGGPFGAVAGSLFGGAVANAYKAAMAYRMGTPDGDAEAKVSATYAVLAAALGGWVAYKFAKPRVGYEQNPEAEALTGGEGGAPTKYLSAREETPEKPGPCRPRRAYPVVSKACEEKP